MSPIDTTDSQWGDMPAVSVVMPAFNAEAFIGETLASLVGQTLRDFEVIVVDDGSTDGTIREAERYSGSLNLKILRQANAGPSAARNAGIRLAAGRHCALLDADDLMLPDCLRVLCEALDADDGAGLAVSDVATFDGDQTIHQARWNLSSLTPDTVLERLVLENFITTSAVMAPTHRWIEAGLFSKDRRVAEDYELWLRMASHWRVLTIDRVLVRYRYRPGSLSDDRLYSARCALEVIEAFWADEAGYAKSHLGVRHRSLSKHLANVGVAALGQGRRSTALAYLARSLWHDPGAGVAWKAVIKSLVPVHRRVRQPSPSVGG